MAAKQETPAQVLKKVRKLCLAYPESSEVEAWGHPTFRAGKKIFCAVESGYKGRPCIGVIVPVPLQLEYAKKAGYDIAPYTGKYGGLCIWSDRPLPWRTVEKLIDESYRRVALKRMLKALDG